MKLKIDTKVIAKLNPCRDRFENWLKHYDGLTLTHDEFLALDKITYSDKLWVLLRMVPRELVEVFALDCAFRAASYANDTTYAANAAAKATKASYAAANTAYATNAATYAARAAANAAADITTANAVYAASYPVADIAAANAAAAANDANDAAATATNVVYATAAEAAERENQLDSLLYLINGWELEQVK